MAQTITTNELAAAETAQPVTRSTSATKKRPLMIAGIVAIALATGVGGFVGGMQYQRGTSASTVAQQGSAMGGRGIMGGMDANMIMGEVTAISDTSITITQTGPGMGSSSSSSGTSKTYTLWSSTTVAASGSSGSLSDIATGDRVMLQLEDDGTTVSSIRTGGGGPGMGQSGSGTTQGTGNSQSTVN